MFESSNGVSLPEDYRNFLMTIGNGGAGPYYGLEALNSFGYVLSEPFPFTKATNHETSDERSKQMAADGHFTGILEFCHHGCAIYSYLIVNGPAYGTIWCGREDFYPTNLSFIAWYRRWLDRALTAFENEKLVPRLRVGMSRVDVLAEVCADWRMRPGIGQNRRFFEAVDIPAQLVLDERDIVIQVIPWQSIVAAPWWPA
jgi:hypothetical protein